MSTYTKRSDQTKIINAQFQYVKNISTQKLINGKIQVNFTDGNSWIDFYGSPASFTFSEPLKNSNSGSYFQQTLSLSNPGDDSDFIINESALIDQKLIVRIQYSDGNNKIFGSRNLPVLYNSNHNSNADSTVYSIAFSAESIARARFEAS